MINEYTTNCSHNQPKTASDDSDKGYTQKSCGSFPFKNGPPSLAGARTLRL